MPWLVPSLCPFDGSILEPVQAVKTEIGTLFASPPTIEYNMAVAERPNRCVPRTRSWPDSCDAVQEDKSSPMFTLHQRKPFGTLTALCTLALLVALAVGCTRASHDLTVRVTDLEGDPLPGAMVGLSENGQTLLADLEGQVRWSELSEAQASLVVVAQGYVLQTAVVSLERGGNETSFALEKQRDEPDDLFDSP